MKQLRYETLFTAILTFFFFSILCNFKLAGVYFSFWVLLSILATMMIFITPPAAKLQSLINVARTRYLIYATVIYFSMNLLTSVETFTLNSYLKNFTKVFAILAFGYFIHRLLLKNILNPRKLLDIFFIFVLCAASKYIISNIFNLQFIDIDRNRPYPDWIGGYNQFSAVIAIAISLVLTKCVKNKKADMLSLFFITILLSALVITLSRAGIVSLGFAFIIYIFIYSKRIFIYLTTAAYAFSVFSLVFHEKNYYLGLFFNRFFGSLVSHNVIVQTSGRNVLWTHTIKELFASDYLQILFGKGLGSFSVQHFTDPHNTYLHILWELGLIVFLLLGFAVIKVYFSIKWDKDSLIATQLKMIFLILSVNLFVEGFQYSTQTAWVLSYMGAILFYHSKYYVNNKAEYDTSS